MIYLNNDAVPWNHIKSELQKASLPQKDLLLSTWLLHMNLIEANITNMASHQ